MLFKAWSLGVACEFLGNVAFDNIDIRKLNSFFKCF